MDESYNYKGCSIKINNLTNSLTDKQCIEFCFKYLSAYLAEDGSYTPIEIREGKDIVIDLREEGALVKIYLNNDLHIEINLFGFHNIQMCCECNTYAHAGFFASLHEHKVDIFNMINIQ